MKTEKKMKFLRNLEFTITLNNRMNKNMRGKLLKFKFKTLDEKTELNAINKWCENYTPAADT